MTEFVIQPLPGFVAPRGVSVEQEAYFQWGQFPPIAQQLRNRPDVHRKRFWRLLEEACDMPVLPDDGRNYTVAHSLVETVVNQALAGDKWAVQTILDRVDGKAVQAVDFSKPDGSAVDAGDAVSAFFSSFKGLTIDVDAEEIEEPLSDLEKMKRGIWKPECGRAASGR